MAKQPILRKLATPDLGDRIKSILLAATAGQRNLADDRQYPTLRRELMRRDVPIPAIVETHPTVDSFAQDMKGKEARQAAARRIQREFGEGWIERQETHADSSTWTGIEARTARLKTIRSMLPLARAAVEELIDTLSQPGPNGGPLMDGREEAVENLRSLHSTLGELLTSIDRGQFDDELGNGLMAEAVRYAKRVTQSLRHDPAPYLSSVLLFGLFSACDFPGVAGYAAGLAATLGHRPSRKS